MHEMRPSNRKEIVMRADSVEEDAQTSFNNNPSDSTQNLALKSYRYLPVEATQSLRSDVFASRDRGGGSVRAVGATTSLVEDIARKYRNLPQDSVELSGLLC